MNINKININFMKLSDLDDVSEVEATAYGAHHWSRESFAGEINNEIARYYVARDENGNLLGYLGTWVIIDEAHVTTLAVSTKFRRCKVAQVLLNNFIDDCYRNKVKYVTLEVRVSNQPAISLYEKFGFNSLGVRREYYQDNFEDALIMWTENIWYDKYKNTLAKVREEISNIEVCVEKK